MNETALINVRPVIRVEGEENSDLGQALTSCVINLPLNGFAHAELTLTNWVATGETGAPCYGFQEVGFGKVVEVLMGEDGSTPVFSGEITALEERYGGGVPQLVLLLQDKLHLMARSRNSRVFEEQSPDDIVTSIADESGLTADVNVSSVTATFHQVNESDLAFLTRITANFGIALRIEGTALRARPEEPDAEPLEISALDSALKVRLIADLNHQPTSITVNGFNADNNETVSELSDTLASPPQGLTAVDVLDELSWEGDEIVSQPFPRSQGEAEGFAKAHFTRMAKRFISGDIRCIGEPTMKSGREMILEGVSPRFAGTYQVINCVHRFDAATGHETHLKINRPDGQA